MAYISHNAQRPKSLNLCVARSDTAAAKGWAGPLRDITVKWFSGGHVSVLLTEPGHEQPQEEAGGPTPRWGNEALKKRQLYWYRAECVRNSTTLSILNCECCANDWRKGSAGWCRWDSRVLVMDWLRCAWKPAWPSACARVCVSLTRPVIQCFLLLVSEKDNLQLSNGLILFFLN